MSFVCMCIFKNTHISSGVQFGVRQICWVYFSHKLSLTFESICSDGISLYCARKKIVWLVTELHREGFVQWQTPFLLLSVSAVLKFLDWKYWKAKTAVKRWQVSAVETAQKGAGESRGTPISEKVLCIKHKMETVPLHPLLFMIFLVKLNLLAPIWSRFYPIL